jgi:hypothetical protein
MAISVGMRVVTSNRKITNLPLQQVTDSVDRVRVTNGSNRANAGACDMPPVSQWDQIQHNEFISGINKGQLIPVWVRSANGTPYGRAGYTKSDSSDVAVEVMVRSIHDFGWSCNKSKYGTTDPIHADSDGGTDQLARLKWGERKGTQTGFPFRAELTVTWINIGPGYQNAVEAGHHEYEMVGAVVCKYPVFHEYAYHSNAEVRQLFVVDVPTSRNDFMISLDRKMASLGGELAELWATHKTEKYLPYADGKYTEHADDRDLLHQRGLLYRDGVTGKWFATAFRGGNNGYSGLAHAGFTGINDGVVTNHYSVNLCFPTAVNESFSEWIADGSRATSDIVGFAYYGDTDTSDTKLMDLLMPLCESFTSAEKHPTWFDEDGKGIPSEFFLQTPVSSRKFGAAAFYESHDYWESKGNTPIRTNNPDLRINENGTYSYLSMGDAAPEFGPQVLEDLGLYDDADLVDKPGGSSSYHYAHNVNSSLLSSTWSTVRVWRDVTAVLKDMLISDAKDTY